MGYVLSFWIGLATAFFMMAVLKEFSDRDPRLKATALQRLKDTYKGDGVVLPSVYRHVMRQLAEKEPDLTQNYMHPSEMSKPDWCGRHDFYRITGTPMERKQAANPSFRMNNAFSEGHTIHEKWQQWFYEMGVLFGDFKCLDCGHKFGAVSPKRCQFCLSERLRYYELPLRRHQLLVEGHADGAIHDLDGWDGLIEVKSIGIQTLRFEAPRLYNLYQDEGQTLEDIWWKINRPFPSHIKQAQLYLWMAWPRYEEMCFIYESKFNQDTKEFVIAYNKDSIAQLIETAREVSHGVRAGVAPDRPLWAEDPDGKTCKSCEFRNTCWGLENKSVTTEENNPSPRVQRAKPAVRKRTLQSAGIRPA